MQVAEEDLQRMLFKIVHGLDGKCILPLYLLAQVTVGHANDLIVFVSGYGYTNLLSVVVKDYFFAT